MRTFFAVALLATGAGGLTGQEGKSYESKEGKFTARFPTLPAVQAKSAGGLTLNLFNADFEKGKGGYLVTYSDLPPEVLKAPLPDQILASSEKAFAEQFMPKEKKFTPLAFGPKKYPAREVTAQRDELSLRGIAVLVGSRMYQVYVYGPKEFVSDKAADAFLASFTIND
jgi:hypothetical protein